MSLQPEAQAALEGVEDLVRLCQRFSLQDMTEELAHFAKKVESAQREIPSRLAKHRGSTIGVQVKTLTGKTLNIPIGPECCVHDLMALVHDK